MENKEFESMFARMNGEHMAFESVTKLMRKYRRLYYKTRKTIYAQRIVITVLVAAIIGVIVYVR